MTTLPARQLTKAHHGLQVTVRRRGHPSCSGRLTDARVGEREVELWVDDLMVVLPSSTPVQLDEQARE